MVKRVWIAGLLATTWALPAFAEELTLDGVVRLSLLRNERSTIASLSVASAEASVRRARAGFLPSVSLGAGETIHPYTAGTNQRTTAANATLTVSQPIVTATAFPTYAGAKHSYEAARHTEVRVPASRSWTSSRCSTAASTGVRADAEPSRARPGR